MAATSAGRASRIELAARGASLFNRFDAADIQTCVRLRRYLPDTDRRMLVARSCLSKGQHRTSEDISGHYGSNTVQKAPNSLSTAPLGSHNMIFSRKPAYPCDLGNLVGAGGVCHHHSREACACFT